VVEKMLWHIVKLHLLVAFMLVIIAATSQAQVTCGEIVLDMPHGWWRVNVKPDGSGNFMFGALPYSGEFASETIDHKKLCSDLHEIATESKEKLGAPIGTVQYAQDSNSDFVWYFSDWDMASNLFKRAWENKNKPSNAIEKKNLEALAKFWENRTLPQK